MKDVWWFFSWSKFWHWKFHFFNPKWDGWGPPNTPKFRDFSYFYMTSLKTKKQDFWFFTAIFSVSKGMVLKKPHHLTHIFNPIPNRVNLSLNRPFYFYYFFKKFFPVKKSQILDFLDFEEENKADQPPNTKIKTLFF